MTARRALGPGPETSADVRATEADLSQALPGERWADLDQLRAGGLFGEPEPAPEPRPRTPRQLGPGTDR
ncbi:hypothetical protein [Streptomyces nitrosporeus]|uniref:hypothetical protein n=1 Tax=Streptomyces nitrosporeus TaxID=28894 RepID=UPI00167CF5BE|nr:hypothetical protein [Streptomyces nitrosporeus]GGZ29937.1 hypothetical protein GCM10010327_70210 [Streptomyces nitrosporeus]